jgi:hypothetical protein
VICVPPIEPELPVFPPPKGDIGPCEDLEYAAPDNANGGHKFISHVLNSWDDRGHIVAQTSFAEDGTQTSAKTRRFDQCGNLIWEETSAASTVSRMENEYSSDGYVVRHAESAGSACTVSSFAYTFDANGKVDAQLDGQGCGWTTRYVYDDQGRLTGAGGLTDGVGYTYFPDGKMSGWNVHGMSISESTQYDEYGAPTASFFGTEVGTSSQAHWSYGPAHELLEMKDDTSFDCGASTTRRAFTHDTSGRLLQEEKTTTSFSWCQADNPPVTQVTTIEYSWPSPDLEIAETKDASGNSIKRVRTSFDARGNVTAVDQAMAPDFTWLPISRRNYDCWAH